MSGPTQGKTILVVDDSELHARMLRRLLAQQGHEVVLAWEGADALQQLGAEPERFGLILLDWEMPVMNGAQFCVERKLRPAVRAIPVVVVSADAHDLNQEEMEVAGVVAKPVRLDALMAFVELLLPK